MSEFSAMAPLGSIRHSVSLIGFPDTTWIPRAGGQESRQVGVAAGLLATIAGILMMTGGDEIGRGGDSGQDGRLPSSAMSGDDNGHQDTGGGDEPILQGYRGLSSARNLSHALRDGRQRWVHGPRRPPGVRARKPTADGADLRRACLGESIAVIAVSTRYVAAVAEAKTASGRGLVLSGHRVSRTADKP